MKYADTRCTVIAVNHVLRARAVRSANGDLAVLASR
jgi:hypothetical protein